MKRNGLALPPVALLLCAAFAAAHAAEKRSPRWADDTPPGKVHVYKQSAGKPVEMEIYSPEGHDPKKARVPGVLLFHGGSWTGGDLNQFRAACHYLAGRGLVAATANYRMLTRPEQQRLPAGESRKRVCITDAKSAIRWFKAHSFFNRDPWRTLTLVASDRFLAQQGLLKGEPALAPPATGEKLLRAP